MILLAVLGVLMVSTIRYTSFKTSGSGKRNLYLVLLIAAVGMLIWLYSKYVVLLLAVIYVSHGVVWHLASLLRPRKTIETES
jgi:CDP-diacylglycerol--serine O-phosphatidyltransferase